MRTTVVCRRRRLTWQGLPCPRRHLGAGAWATAGCVVARGTAAGGWCVVQWQRSRPALFPRLGNSAASWLASTSCKQAPQPPSSPAPAAFPSLGISLVQLTAAWTSPERRAAEPTAHEPAPDVFPAWETAPSAKPPLRMSNEKVHRFAREDARGVLRRAAGDAAPLGQTHDSCGTAMALLCALARGTCDSSGVLRSTPQHGMRRAAHAHGLACSTQGPCLFPSLGKRLPSPVGVASMNEHGARPRHQERRSKPSWGRRFPTWETRPGTQAPLRLGFVCGSQLTASFPGLGNGSPAHQ